MNRNDEDARAGTSVSGGHEAVPRSIDPRGEEYKARRSRARKTGRPLNLFRGSFFPIGKISIRISRFWESDGGHVYEVFLK